MQNMQTAGKKKYMDINKIEKYERRRKILNNYWLKILIAFILCSNRYLECGHGNTVPTCFYEVDPPCDPALIFDPSQGFCVENVPGCVSITLKEIIIKGG